MSIEIRNLGIDEEKHGLKKFFRLIFLLKETDKKQEIIEHIRIVKE